MGTGNSAHFAEISSFGSSSNSQKCKKYITILIPVCVGIGTKITVPKS